MRYLGALRGAGTLTGPNDETSARADYDFDVFVTHPSQVTGSGELRMSPEALREVFGRKDLQLKTDDGRMLSIRFSEKRLRSATETATHVDVAGDLPSAADWRH
jgi:hypothetical protein